jgi:transposase InsO family protein
LAEKSLTGINQAWVADITYIGIHKGFVFLAAILDRYSRKIIGWAISQRIDAELCVAVLRIALEQRQPPPGCIHHSDRGVQYACAEYIALLQLAQMQISMSRIANPYDNAHMESFFKTLKYEEVHLANYETYDDVIKRIPHFIEEVYKQQTAAFSLGVSTSRWNTRWRFKQQKRLVAPPSNLAEISPVGGAHSTSRLASSGLSSPHPDIITLPLTSVRFTLLPQKSFLLLTRYTRSI